MSAATAAKRLSVAQSRARFRDNVRQAIAQGGVRGGADDPPADDPPADDPPPDDPPDDPPADDDKDAAAAKAKAKEAVDKERAKTAAEKDRADGLEKQIAALKKTQTKDQKEALEELEKQLADMRASIKQRDDDDKTRVEGRLAKLPEAARKKLEAVKDQIPLAALEHLIDSEDAMPPPKKDTTPNAPGGGPSRNDNQADGVPKNVMTALRKAGRKGAADALEGLDFSQTADGNHNKWRMPMDDMLDEAERRSRDRFSIEPPKGMALATKDVVLRGADIPTKDKRTASRNK